MAPDAAVIAPGHATAPAQALADALGRPVLAPDASFVIGRDGSANVVRRPATDATAFGRGWQQGNWVASFPAAPETRRAPAPRPLGYNLADAITTAQRELGWQLGIIGPPSLVPPPTHDVHFPVVFPENEIAEWTRGTRRGCSRPRRRGSRGWRPF